MIGDTAVNVTFGQTNVPPGLTNVIAIAAGWSYSMALKSDGTITFWGDNYFGQTNGAATLKNITTIAARDNRGLGITTDLRILSLARSNDDAVLSFHSFAGRQYFVEFSSDLSSTNWQTSGLSGIAGNGMETFTTDTNAFVDFLQRFYRTRESDE